MRATRSGGWNQSSSSFGSSSSFPLARSICRFIVAPILLPPPLLTLVWVGSSPEGPAIAMGGSNGVTTAIPIGGLPLLILVLWLLQSSVISPDSILANALFVTTISASFLRWWLPTEFAPRLVHILLLSNTLGWGIGIPYRVYRGPWAIYIRLLCTFRSCGCCMEFSRKVWLKMLILAKTPSVV